MTHSRFFAAILGLLLLVTSETSGQYSQGCSRALEDLPDPSSDSCQAFFRCFNGHQYSLRCPLGQVFDFDRSRCRLTNSVNCQLQLQRFQAPAVPGYMWPNQRSPQEGQVEIRVVHVGPDTAGNLPGQNSPSLESSNQAGPARAPLPQLPGRAVSNNQGHVQGQATSQGGQARQAGHGQGQIQTQDQRQQNNIPNFLPGGPVLTA
ncbi:hypothetical protein RRG08_017377 [Elysia crispata]|uniref:Chitin-binding type-2 domain-containing protein n=1 Tax=Elysia crispata TaxID=231223 RepID=A0AAE1D5J0_9GAST|nr:hypothetical protein RRG08_017377 [Elysia crispata]